MEVRELDRGGNIDIRAKSVLGVYDATFEEFVSFVKEKVDAEGLEMYFMHDETLTYAYFEEIETVFVHVMSGEEAATTMEQVKESLSREQREAKEVKKSGIFTRFFMIFLLLTSSLVPNTAEAAGYFSGSMSEDPTVYTGLAKAKFNTPTGTANVPGFLSIVKSKIYQDTAFTYVNPNRISAQPSVNLDSLPSGANENLLVALLAYRQKFNLNEIASSTGIQVTQRQLDEATQLAIWLNASSVQVDYQIDANSITDTAVRSLATEITTWATQQVNSLPDGSSMGTYLFPDYKPELNASKAKVNNTGKYVEYGPYRVSGQKSAKFAYGVLGGVLLDASKNEIKELKSAQEFYVRFPVSYTGDKSVRLVSQTLEYSLSYGQGRLWLDKAAKPVEVKFSVGKSTGTNGLIQINAIDSLTNKPVEGVGVEISTTSPIGSVQTDGKGSAEYTAPIGTYHLKFTVPEGYMTPQDQEIGVTFAGDIQTINLGLNWSKAVVNFHTVDAQTLKPTGDSEAFIYDSNNKAVKRVAVTNGKVNGVTLPEGDYTFVQYKTSDGYGINIGTPFKAVAGKVTDVSVTQDPNVQPTTFTIEGASSGDSWVYTVSSKSKVLFKMNSSNTLSIPLPSGDYSVMAQKSDGTATAGPLNFSTVLNGKTDVLLTQEKGTETITFNFLDTKVEKPIPNVVIGLFDENHNLITQATADANGSVKFENVKKYSIYYINVLAAPDTVSGYSADGNRFLGATRDYNIRLYSLAEIQEVTKVDTLYRVPNVTYVGASYTYPQ